MPPVFERGGGSTAATCSSLVLANAPADRALVTGAGASAAASGVTAAQLDALRGLTGPVQAQLSSASPSGFAANRALASDAAGNVAASAVTSTELGFLRGLSGGLSGGLQARLDAGAQVVSMPYSWQTNGPALADSPLAFTPEPAATYAVDARLIVYANVPGHSVSYGVRWPSPLHGLDAGMVTMAYQSAADTPATLRSSSRAANVPVCTLQTTTLANTAWMLSVRAVFTTAASGNITPFAIVASANNRSRWAQLLYGSHLTYRKYANPFSDTTPPTITSSLDSAYTLAINGTATVITVTATDPSTPITYGYEVTSGTVGSTASISQTGGAFTITPSTNSAHAGSFALRFWARDSYTNTAYTASATFTLNFNVLVYLTPVTSISDIPSSFTNQLAENQVKFLRYTIRKPSGGSQTVTVCVLRSGTTVSQSAFYLNPSGAFSYSGSAASAINYGNDDHDSLVMDGDGNWVVCRTNASTDIAGRNFDKGNGTSVITTNTIASSVFITAPLVAAYQTLVAFPATGMSVWIDISNGQYKMSGGYSAQPFAWATYIGSGSFPVYTISDQVNSFIIGRHNSINVLYVEMDLSTGTIHTWQLLPELSLAPGYSSNTEEDAFGNQLFAVNGAVTFHKNGMLYYGGTVGWRAFTEFNETNSSTAIGVDAFQTGMDVFGSVGGDRYVWFADWGHDNGGLFGIGNDSDLGVRKTNILMLPANFEG